MLLGRLITYIYLLCGRGCWSCCAYGFWSDCADAWTDLNPYILTYSVLYQDVVMLLERLITFISLLCGRGYWSCCVYEHWSDCADAWADLNPYILTSSVLYQEVVVLLGRLIIPGVWYEMLVVLCVRILVELCGVGSGGGVGLDWGGGWVEDDPSLYMLHVISSMVCHEDIMLLSHLYPCCCELFQFWNMECNRNYVKCILFQQLIVLW